MYFQVLNLLTSKSLFCMRYINSIDRHIVNIVVDNDLDHLYHLS